MLQVILLIHHPVPSNPIDPLGKKAKSNKSKEKQKKKVSFSCCRNMLDEASPIYVHNPRRNKVYPFI